MLYRASVQDVKTKRISRKYGYFVVIMQFYPRFLTKEMIDEYCRSLAPQRDLFTEFKEIERATKDHDGAFSTVRYEERFEILEGAKADLQRLSKLSKERDVYLICQCSAVQKCHADLVLLAARTLYGAEIPFLRRQYPAWTARLEVGV